LPERLREARQILRAKDKQHDHQQNEHVRTAEKVKHDSTSLGAVFGLGTQFCIPQQCRHRMAGLRVANSGNEMILP
jgi:lysine/ornithine N-monooxygenase